MTETFWSQGDFVAQAVGMPDVPRLMLPHPVAGTGAQRMGEIAEQIADELLGRLAGQ